VGDPFRDVAIVGVFNTKQARVLEGHDTQSIALEAALGAIRDAGLEPRDIDGVVGGIASNFLFQSRIGPAWRSMSPLGIPAVIEGAMAIACGLATIVVAIRANRGLGRPAPRPFDPSHWRLGQLYKNAEDPALFVPTRDGRRWTLNFGRPVAGTLLGVILTLGVLAPTVLVALAFR